MPLLAVIAWPTVAGAQVNTERLRSWDVEGFSGSADFSLNLQSGNVSLLNVGSSVRLQYATLQDAPAGSTRRRGEDLIYLIGNLSFGEKRNEQGRPRETFVNNGFAHLRWTRMWIPWLGTELFGQIQYNEFIRLSRRLLGGAGLRFALVEHENAEIHVGSGYMLEYEALDIPEDDPHPASTLFNRSTSYISIKLYLKEPAVALVNTAYVQPRFEDPADYRVIDDAEVSISITDVFSVVWAFSLRYDSKPPGGVKKLDTAFTHNLRVSF